MEHLKPLLPAGGDASELEAAAQALAGLSPEDRDLLAAVQESPYPPDHPGAVPGVSRPTPSILSWSPTSARWRMWAGAIWRSIWMSFCPRSCWTPLIPFPSAITPCRRNRAALRAEAISLSPATSGSMSAPGRSRRRKSPPSRSGWSRAGRNVPIRARRSPIGKSLRRN